MILTGALISICFLIPFGVWFTFNPIFIIGVPVMIFSFTLILFSIAGDYEETQKEKSATELLRNDK